MVKLQRGESISAPSSALGIMRFFDADTAGPKISPEVTIGVTFAFIVIILGLKTLLSI